MPLHSRLRLAFMILLPVLALAAPLRAQGTSGVFPDPIAAGDLDAYGQRLGLSEQQRLAVDRAHEDYLHAFEVLRDGAMETYVAETGSHIRALFSQDTGSMRKAIKGYERIMQRIRTADERFFDQVQTVLTDEQSPALLRVRHVRERARHASGIVRFLTRGNPDVRIDLSQLVAQADLPPEEHRALDPLTDEYEQRLNSAVRTLDTESKKMFQDIIRQMEAMGADALAQGRMRSLREIWSAASAGTNEAAAAISTLNRRAVRTFASMLSETSARRLRAAWMDRAYHEIQRGEEKALPRFDAALRLAGLDEEQRETVQAARDDLRRRLDGLAEQMIDLEQTLRRGGLARRFQRGPAPPEQVKLGALRKQRDAVNEKAIAALNVVIGPELAAVLDRGEGQSDGPRGARAEAGRPDPAAGRRGARGRRAAPSPAADGNGDPGARGSGDPYVPGPITAEEVDSYRRRLGLDADQGAVLMALLEDYRDRYTALRGKELEPLREAAGHLWQFNQDRGRVGAPTDEQIDAVFDRRERAFAAVRALDEAFFTDLELALSAGPGRGQAAGMRRVRAARDRVVFGGGPSAAASRGSGDRGWWNRFRQETGQEPSLDLAALFAAQQPTDEERAAADEALGRYELAAAERFQQRHELEMNIGRAREQLRAEAARRRASGERHAWDTSTERGRLVQRLDRQRGEAEREMVDLNRQALAEIAAAVPAPLAATLETAYRRAAHPEVYDDPGALEERFRAVLELTDLTEGQRGQVAELLAEYRPPYDRLCQGLVDLTRTPADESESPWRERWQRQQERRNAREKLRFQRDELNDKSLRRLRAVLSDDQIQRLGMGPAAGTR